MNDTKAIIENAVNDYRTALRGQAKAASTFPPSTRVIAVTAIDTVWKARERKFLAAVNHWRDVVLTQILTKLYDTVDRQPPAETLDGAVVKGDVLFCIIEDNPQVHR